MARLFFYRGIARLTGDAILLEYEKNNFTGFSIFPAECISIGLQHGHARMGNDF